MRERFGRFSVAGRGRDLSRVRLLMTAQDDARRRRTTHEGREAELRIALGSALWFTLRMSDETNIADLAGACVDAVKRALGFELDYTQDTLPILDHYIDGRVADDAVLRTKPEVIDLVAPMCGAYFGQVVRAHLGGARWHAPGQEYGLYRLEFERCFLHFNPVGVIVESIVKGEAEGWAAHLQMLEQDRDGAARSLRLTGDVRDDDYYRLGVRFEVIEQVHRVVSSAALARGDASLHFSHEVYEAAAATGVLPGDGTLQ